MDVVISSAPGAESAPRFAQHGRGVTDPRDRAILTLGLQLKREGYRFTAVTPATHHRVNVRKPTFPLTREDVFGWSRSFGPDDLPEWHMNLLAAAGELTQFGSLLRSRIRFSTLSEQLFLHSAFPTEESDAVFFGPDTYRFARLIRDALPKKSRNGLRLLDVGAGSGAGALYAASLLPAGFVSIVLSDINSRALRFSRINALLNGVGNVEVVESNLFEQLPGTFDLIIANPPYLVDPSRRLYRHGGGRLGSKLSLKIVEQAIDRLAPAGRLVLYTGSAIVNGVDHLRNGLSAILNRADIHFQYEEIDPDVFGEELDHWPYERADRIAVIGLVVDRIA